MVKGAPINVRLDERLMQRVREIAAEERRSVSNFIGVAVEEYVAKKDRERDHKGAPRD